MYDLERVDLYSKHHLGELPPHIFAIANECYRCIWKRHDSQCVLIRLVWRNKQTDITSCPHRSVIRIFLNVVTFVFEKRTPPSVLCMHVLSFILIFSDALFVARHLHSLALSQEKRGKTHCWAVVAVVLQGRGIILFTSLCTSEIL